MLVKLKLGLRVFTYILYVLTLVVSLGETVNARVMNGFAVVDGQIQAAEGELPSIRLTTADGRTSVCEGESVTFNLSVSGLTGYTVSWRKTGMTEALQETGESYLLTAVTSEQKGNYYCEVLAGEIRYFSDTVELKVAALPQVSLAKPEASIYCLGDKLTLTTSLHGGNIPEGMRFSWSGNGIEGSAEEESVTVCLPEGKTTYKLKVQQEGCVVEDAVELETAKDIKIDKPEQLTYCKGTQLTLQTTIHGQPTKGIVWAWTGAGISGESEAETVQLRLEENPKFYLQATQGNCVQQDSIEFRITENFAFSVVEPEGGTTYCAGDEVTVHTSLHGLVPDGATFQWTGEGIAGDGKTEEVHIKLEGDGLYEVVCHSGGCSVTASIQFDIQKYELKINQPQDLNVCYKDEITLTTSVHDNLPVGATFSWAGEGIVGGEKAETVKVQPAENNKFCLVSTYGACKVRDSVVFVVQPAYEVKIKMPEEGLNICPGTQLQLGLEAAAPEGATLSWSGKGITGEHTGSSVMVEVTDEPKYKLTSMYNYCTAVDSLVFDIQEAYAVQIKQPATGLDVCSGDELELGTTLTDIPGGATFKWTGAAITGATDQEKVNLKFAGDGNITLYTRYKACEVTRQISFRIQPAYTVKIAMPDEGLDVCYDKVVELKTTQASIPEGMTFRWMGDGLEGDRTQEKVKVRLTENDKFKLHTEYGVCQADDEITFSIKKYDGVRIVQHEVSVLDTAQEIRLTAIRTNDAQLKWYLDDQLMPQFNNRDTIYFKVKDDARVKAEQMLNNCTSVDYCNIIVRKVGVDKYKGRYGDGFTESRPGLQLIYDDLTVCQGMPAIVRLNNVYTGYHYEWFKWDKDNAVDVPVGQLSYLEIPKCKLEDAGYYFCRVKDIDTEGTPWLYSDTLHLTVNPAPVAEIIPPDRKLVCYGEEVRLNTVAVDQACRYEWAGPGLSVEQGEAHLAFPVYQSGYYGVALVTDVCRTHDSLWIEVKEPLVLDVIENIRLAEAQEITISAYRENPAIPVTWTLETETKTSVDPVTFNITKEGIIYASISENECVSTDSCRIFIKAPVTFHPQGDNEGDGFAESGVGSLHVREKLLAVCTGVDVTLALQEEEMQNCLYEWYKDNETTPVYTGYSYPIFQCTEAMRGDYYCKAVRGGEVWVSDTLSLQVTPGPLAKISGGNDLREVCRGGEFALEATPEGYTYRWEGEHILDPAARVMKAVAEQEGYYTVEVSDGATGCYTRDSVYVRLRQPYLRIPERILRAEPTEVKMAAERISGAASVKWEVWTDGLKYQTSGTDSVTLPLSGSGYIIAILEDNGCQAKDTCQVFIKNAYTFKGHDDDGFALSRPWLRLKDKSLAPCASADVRLELADREVGGAACEWFWINVDGIETKVGEGTELALMKCTPDDNGSYYCRMMYIPEGNYLYSDTLSLTVKNSVQAKITEPARGISWCYGSEPLTIKAEPEGAYTYHWSGESILSGEETAAITVKPQQTTRYEVMISDGECHSTDTITINVNRVKVELLPQVALSGPQKYRFPVYNPGGAPLSWQIITGTEGGSWLTTDSLEITGECRVVVKAGGDDCNEYDTCQVYMRAPALYAGSDDDGFALSHPCLQVKNKLMQPCETEDVVLELAYVETGFWKYQWYKVGESGDLPLAAHETDTLLRCKTGDSGFYYCVAVNADGEKISSDTLKLDVLPGLDARISGPVGRNWCYGAEPLRLTAAPEGDFTYTWSGPAIISGAHSAAIEARPESTAKYTVVIDNGTCHSLDTMTIQVNRHEVDIQPQLALSRPQRYHIPVYNPGNAPLEWQMIVQGESKVLGDADSITLEQECIIVVKAGTGECCGYDTCHVFIRIPQAYNESVEDGFAASMDRMRVRVKKLTPCPTEDVRLELVHDDYGYQGYEWCKVAATDIPVGRGTAMDIFRCTEADNGDYFCRVPNPVNGGYLYSDTLSIKVGKGVIATIDRSHLETSYCYGSGNIVLSVTPVGDYTYEWAGSGILSGEGTAEIVARPEMTTLFRVSVNDGVCSSQDTVTIRVNRTDVEIMPQLALAYPQRYGFKVYNPARTVLHWQVITDKEESGWMLADSLDLKEDCIVVVKAGEGDCIGYDTCRVFVKHLPAHSGDADDGFAESRPALQLVKESEAVCQSNAVTLEVRDFGYKGYQYTWYKRNDDGTSAFIGNGRAYTLEKVMPGDAGFYYCEATVMGDTVFSPDFGLTVAHGPLISIASVDGVRCYASGPLQLDASATDASSHSGKGFVYAWEGTGILSGENTAKPTVWPESDTWYVLTVTDKDTKCPAKDSILIRVNHFEVEIPEVITLAGPQESYRFKVYNPDGAALEWWVDDALAEMKEGGLKITSDCKVVVKAVLGDCEEYDTCQVYVRGNVHYTPEQNKYKEDGFAVSAYRPVVSVSPKEQDVCTGNMLRVEAKINVDGVFLYKWMKLNTHGEDTGPYSEEAVLELPDMNENMAGQYYCIVVDVLNNDPLTNVVLSDTVMINYLKGPKAKILGLAEGETVCSGTEVQLSATVENDPTGRYKYTWSGENILDPVANKTVRVIPRFSGIYQVTITDMSGQCSNTATLRMELSNPEIRIPDQKHLAEAGEVVIAPEKANGGKVNWYLNNSTNKVLTDRDTFRMNISTDTKIIVELEQDKCSGYDTSWVYVKSPYTFKGAQEDGFASAISLAVLRQETGETEFCRGAELFRTVSGIGPGRLLKYEWRKLGSPSIVSGEKDLVISPCEMSDSGYYYCLAVDVSSSEQTRFYSDTVKITVKPGPVAHISVPVDGKEVCYATPFELSAKETEISKYPTTDVYTYTWTGEGVASPHAYETTALPVVDGTYYLEVTNGECTSYDTVKVRINTPEVSIQRTIYVAERDTFWFSVENPEKNKVNWYLDQKQLASGKDSVQIFLYDDSQVVVEMTQPMEEGVCSRRDTCLVFFKDPRPFVVSSNSGDDGFYVSGTSFYIQSVESSELVCVGATAVFTIKVVGNDFYKYAWKKEGRNEVLSTEVNLRLPACRLEDAGNYYCEVTDGSSGKTLTSQKAPLQVVAVPRPHILTSSAAVCEDTPITLSADDELLEVDRNYVFLWSGPDLTERAAKSVTVTPKQEKTTYVLTISDANCFAKDTIELNMKPSSLKVPDLITINQGEDISIQAEIPAGMNVNWVADGLLYTSRNPLVLTGLTKNIEYVAKTTGDCPEEAAGRIQVRTLAGYAGGEDDGFSMPNELPQIIDQSPSPVGCGQDTAVLWVKVLKKDKVKQPGGYVWEKYDEARKTYFTVAAAPNIVGLDSNELYFRPILPENEGRYRCRVVGENGVTKSSDIYLIRGDVPVIDSRMKDFELCENGNVLLQSSASVPRNGKDPSYRWYFSEAADNFRQLLPEVALNKSYYEIDPLVKAHQGYYMVEAYNLCGSVYDTAQIEVWQKPWITYQNNDTVVCLYGNIKLWVEPAGGGDQWRYQLYQVEADLKGNYKKDVRKVYDDLNAFFDIEMADESYNGYFRWIVANNCDTVAGKLFKLTVEPKPTIAYSFKDTTICLGTAPVILNASANVISPSASTKYYWTKNDVRMSQTNNSYRIPSLAYADTGVYRCYAYNACPAQEISKFTLHKKETPVILQDPKILAGSYCEGYPVDIVVEYTSDAGAGMPHWYHNNNRMTDQGDRVTGTQRDTLSIAQMTAGDEGKYKVYITNGCPGTTVSNEVNLHVKLPARYAAGGDLSGKDLYLCTGNTGKFEVTATGEAPITYTWLKDNNVLMGERGASLTVSNVTTSSEGIYQCFIQNECSQDKGEGTEAELHVISPVNYAVSVEGNGKYCGYEAGCLLTMPNFERSVTYRLYVRRSVVADALVKTVAGSSVPAGEALNFGVWAQGTYYVIGETSVGSKTCRTKMGGDIRIIRDVTPNQYELFVSDPLCTGELAGNLSLRGSDKDPKMEYVLQRLTAEGEWIGYNKTLTGTGEQLDWNNCPVGTYRVMARHLTSGCHIQIGENIEMVERPMPEVFALLPVNGDTTNCAGMADDVRLQLSGTATNCTYQLVKDGEVTELVATGNPPVWGPVSGTAAGTLYQVKATTDYGCVDTIGRQVVVQKAAPRRLAVTPEHGGYYCTADTDPLQVNIAAPTQEGIRYDVYAVGGAKLTDALLYGDGGVLSFEVPLKTVTYYVQGVDTLDGCKIEMSNRFTIREDKLKVETNPKDTTITAGLTAQLGAEITGNVGNVHLSWASAAKLVDPTVIDPVTVPLNRPERFVITVSDNWCTVEDFADVLIKGDSLSVAIKQFDCYTDKDTMWVCQNAPLTLCAGAIGGKGSYTYRWWVLDLDDQVVEIGTDSRLYDYRMKEKGYIYLEVVTDKGQKAIDSVWVNMEHAPVSCPFVNNGCVLPGETATFVLQYPENNVRYTLEFAPDNVRYKTVSDAQTGDGVTGQFTYDVVYDQSTDGYYRIKAEIGQESGNTCVSYMDTLELREKPTAFALRSIGETVYCAGSHRDTLCLASSQANVEYLLINTSVPEVVASLPGNEDSLLFIGYFGSGRYRVLAKQGICQDTMSGVVNINARPLPVVDPSWTGSYCWKKGYEGQEIGLKTTLGGSGSAAAPYEYTLYWENEGLISKVASVKGDGSAQSFGKQTKIGRYFIVSEDSYHCTDTLRDMAIIKSPSNVSPQEISGTYPATEPGWVTTLEIYNTEYPLEYILVSAENDTEPVAEFGGWDGNKLYCECTLTEGTYYVKALAGGCSAHVSTVRVYKCTLTAAIEPIDPIPAGTPVDLTVRVDGNQGNVSYNWQPEKMIEGDHTFRDITTVQLKKGQRFIVSVKDDRCEAEASVDIRVEGEDLSADIVLADGVTPVDTLRLCQGDKVNLKSWTTGGTGEVAYEWKDKNGVIGRNLSELTDFTMTADGFIALHAATQIGQTSEDTVWVVFRQNPGRDISLEKENLNCMLPEENVHLTVNAPENGVKYALEYSGNGTVYTAFGETYTGEGTPIQFNWKLTDGAGYYRLKAVKEYTDGGKCPVYFDAVEVRERPAKMDIRLLSKAEYCEKTQHDTICVDSSQYGVTYQLVRVGDAAPVKIATLSGTNDSLLFTGYYGSGNYQVSATLGSCEETMNGTLAVVAHQNPELDVKDLYAYGDYCWAKGDPGLHLGVKTPVIHPGASPYYYQLIREYQGEHTVLDSKSLTESKAIDWGYKKDPGSYLITVSDRFACTDTVREMRVILAPKDVKLVENKGMFCYGDEGWDTTVKIYDIDPMIDYVLTTTAGVELGHFGELSEGQDTMYFTGVLPAGVLAVKAIAGDCKRIVAQITVTERAQLMDKPLIAPLTACHGQEELTMGVQHSEAGIVYELYERIDGGIDRAISSRIKGDGGEIVLAKRNTSGSYYVLAADTVLGCEQKMSEEYAIRPLPEYYDITVQNRVYCEGERGATLGISATQRGVNYTLQKKDEESAAFVNVTPVAKIIGLGSNEESVFSGYYGPGTYRIVADVCGNEPMRGEVKVEEIALPAQLTVKVIGNPCVDSALNIVLSETEAGVKYVLFHEGIDMGLDTIRGNGADQQWIIDAAQQGTYSVQAIRQFCARTLEQQITIGMPVHLSELTGIQRMCANEIKTLTMGNPEPGVVYKLWGSQRDTLIVGAADESEVIFADVPAGDTYYIVGFLNMCETRSKPYHFEGIELPVFHADDFVISDCDAALKGAGQITLQNMNREYSYLLTGPDAKVVADLLRPEKDTTFTEMIAGEYSLLVTDRTSEAQCSMDKIYKTVRKPVPADSLVQPLMYCDGEEGLILKLSASTYQVSYQLLTARGEELETINFPMKNFVLPHQEGSYLFRKEVIGLNGGCSTTQPVEIKKLLQPYPDFEVISDGGKTGICETGENRITILGAEKDVMYILRRSDGFDADTVIGKDDIGPIVFEGRKPAGEYRIYAYNAAGCESVFSGTFKINPVPEPVMAKGSVYCFNPDDPEVIRGGEVKVSGLSPYAAYYLQGEEGMLDTISLRNSGVFKFVGDGAYAVIGEFQATGCRDTVALVAIEGISAPKVFKIRNSLTGSNCAELAVVTLDQTEGDSIEYTLYMNNDFVIEGPLAGTGGRLDFSGVSVDGQFRVKAQRRGAECAEWMDGKVVITTQPQKPVFVSSGFYCQGSDTSTIRLMLENGMKGWKYYVASSGGYSDTLQIIGDPAVVWDTVGNTCIKNGLYELWGINECDEAKLLAELTIGAMPLPAVQSLKENDMTLCSQFVQDFVLAHSEKNVRYNMIFHSGNDVLNINSFDVAGSEDTLVIHAQVKDMLTGPGTYYIIGTVDSTGCQRIVDTARVNVSYTPNDPAVVGEDVCIQPGTTGAIKVGMGKTAQPAIDYWLVVNDSVVDFIDRNDFVGKDIYFKEQSTLGCYVVIGDNGFCQRKAQGPCLGETPALDIPVLGAGEVTLCSGDEMPVILESSQIGCRYMLVTDGNVGRDTVIGTGERLEVGRVNKAGTYQVYAMVSGTCFGVLNDVIQVRVLQRPELNIVQEASYCDGGQGVNFTVLNSLEGVDYYLYRKHPRTGELTTLAARQAGSGEDFTFIGNDGKPYTDTVGLYRIEAVDPAIEQCPANDTVRVTTIPALQRFAVEVLESPYVCDGPEEKTIMLKSSEKSVEYALYLERTGQMVSRLVEGTGLPLRFTVTDTGTYYVVGQATQGETCEARMGNTVTIEAPVPLTVYELVGDTTGYCETLDRTPGQLHLPGSDGTEVSYQLYRDGVPYGEPKAGKNGGYLTWTKLEGKSCSNAQGDADGYKYTVVATHTGTGCSRPMNGRVDIIRESMVVIEKQDTNLNVCMGSENRIMVTATGCGLQYEWRKDGVVVGNQKAYEIDSITEDHIGIYTCDVSNSCNMTSIIPVSVKVRAVVILDEKMEDVLVCPEGGKTNVTLATKAVAEKYEWKKLGGNDAVLSHSSVLSLKNVGKEAEGYYECVASTTCGALKDTCLLEFDRAAEIKFSGLTQVVQCVGSEYHIALDSRDSVKWLFNGAEMEHLGYEYTIDSVKLSDAGDYAVQAWNKCSSTEIRQLQNLFVDDTIRVISVTDSMAHFCNGEQVTLQITTQPAQGVEYTWYQNGRPQSETSNQFKVGRVTDANDNTSYWVYYQNTCNRGMQSIKLLVDNALKYDKLGDTTLACAEVGNTKVLKVKDQDAEGEKYQWYYRRSVTDLPVALEGTASSLALPCDTSSNGYYFCNIRNACETINSDTTLLRVDSMPVILSHLSDTTICENGSFVFGIRATGGGVTYQWQMKRRNSNEVTTPEVFYQEKYASSSVMELKTVSVIEDSCLVWCKVTNSCGTAYSDTAVVRVTHNATVVFERNEVNLCPGTELKMVARLEHAEPDAKYVYYYSVNGVMAKEITFKGLTDTVVFPNAAAGTYKIESLESNGKCYDDSPNARMKVTHQTPLTATISGGGKACFGNSLQIELAIKDSDSENWVVELRRRSDRGIATEFGDSLLTFYKDNLTRSIQVTKDETYYIGSIYEANNPFGCPGKTQGTAEFKVLLPAAVSFTPKDTIFGGCTEVDLNEVLLPKVTVNNSPLYDARFYVNGLETQSTLLSKEPGVYRVVYKTTTENNCVDSAVVRLTRDPLPSVTVIQGDTNICPGETAQVIYHIEGKVPQSGRSKTFKVFYTGSDINKDGLEVFPDGILSNRNADKDNNLTFDVTNVGENKARIYRIRSVTDRYGCDLSSAELTTTVTMRQTPQITVATMSEFVNNGIAVTDQNNFILPAGALVNFTVYASGGTNPWKISMEKNDTIRKTTDINITDQGTAFNANGEGVYRFMAWDKYCPISDYNFSETRRTVTYTESGYLKVKVFLEGAVNKAAGTMKSEISNLLPKREDMTQWPVAGEGLQWIDWVTLELRKQVDSLPVVKETFLLRSDGMIIDPATGSDVLPIIGTKFSDLRENTYYVVVKHRNHLTLASRQIRVFTDPASAQFVDLTQFKNLYTFDGDLQSHVSSVTLENGMTLWCMSVGNVLSNALISVANPNEIQKAPVKQTTQKGYYLLDVNFDGQVKWATEGVLKSEDHTADDAYLIYKNRHKFSEIPE